LVRYWGQFSGAEENDENKSLNPTAGKSTDNRNSIINPKGESTMNTISTTQPKAAKKLTLNKETIRLLANDPQIRSDPAGTYPRTYAVCSERAC
jgi:hypothetical protein